MTYVLHRQLGEDIVITRGGRDDSPAARGGAARQHLPGRAADVAGQLPARCSPSRRAIACCSSRRRAGRRRGGRRTLEDALADFGADATGTAERLAQFHRVENTYLSTFQTLGGLGLLLGTVGLATVLLRNVLERRRELALLGAVGFRRGARADDGRRRERAAARRRAGGRRGLCRAGDRAGGRSSAAAGCR